MERLPRKLKKRFKTVGVPIGYGIEMQIRFAKYTKTSDNKYTIKDFEDMLYALSNHQYEK